MYELLPRHANESLGSVASELPWFFGIDDGVILTKRGGFMSSFAVSGPDATSISDEEATRLAREVEAAFNRLSATKQWWPYDNYIRIPSMGYTTNNHFSSTVTTLIDTQRAALYNAEGAHYESRYIVTLLFQPPVADRNDLAMMYMPYEQRAARRTPNWLLFEDGVRDFVQTLKNAGITTRRLQVREVRGADGHPLLIDEHLSFLKFCLTGEFVPVQMPDDYSLIGNYLSMEAARMDDYPMLGERHVVVVGVRAAPRRSASSLFEVLDRFKLPLRMSVRGALLTQAQSLSELEAIRSAHEGNKTNIFQTAMKALGFDQNPRMNTAAARLEADAQRFKDNIELDEHRLAHVTINGVFIGPDAKTVMDDANLLVSQLNEMGFGAIIETSLASRAFFGSMPGDTQNNLMRLPLKTRTLAHMFPVTGVWPGLDRNPSSIYPKNSPPTFYGRTTGSAPFRFCNHAMDSNGHWVIQGGSGAGKTTLINTFLAGFDRNPGAQGIIIDRLYSMYALAKAMEVDGAARHLDLAAAIDEARPVLAPLAGIAESASKREYVKGLVEVIMNLANVPPTVETRKQLRRGILALSEQPKNHHTLSNLAAVINDERVRGVIKDFVTTPGGQLLNAPAEDLGSTPFLFFEMGSFMDSDVSWKLPILMHIVHLVDERTSATRPMMFVLDEAWMFFENDYMEGVLRSLLRTARKRNLAVLFATQQIADISGENTLAQAIQGECLTKVFLPSPGLEQNQKLREKYKQFLTDYEIYNLSEKLQRLNDYYYVSPVGRRTFSLELQPFTLAFVGVEGERLDLVKRLVEEDPKGWIPTYLREINLPEWADAFADAQQERQRRARAA